MLDSRVLMPLIESVWPRQTAHFLLKALESGVMPADCNPQEFLGTASRRVWRFENVAAQTLDLPLLARWAARYRVHQIEGLPDSKTTTLRAGILAEEYVVLFYSRIWEQDGVLAEAAGVLELLYQIRSLGEGVSEGNAKRFERSARELVYENIRSLQRNVFKGLEKVRKQRATHSRKELWCRLFSELAYRSLNGFVSRFHLQECYRMVESIRFASEKEYVDHEHTVPDEDLAVRHWSQECALEVFDDIMQSMTLPAKWKRGPQNMQQWLNGAQQQESVWKDSLKGMSIYNHWALMTKKKTDRYPKLLLEALTELAVSPPSQVPVSRQLYYGYINDQLEHRYLDYLLAHYLRQTKDVDMDVVWLNRIERHRSELLGLFESASKAAILGETEMVRFRGRLIQAILEWLNREKGREGQ